jgi:hypothetical protein
VKQLLIALALLCAPSCTLLGISAPETGEELFDGLLADVQDARTLLEDASLAYDGVDDERALVLRGIAAQMLPIENALALAVTTGDGTDTLAAIDSFLAAAATIQWSADPAKNASIRATAAIAQLALRRVRRRLEVPAAPPEPPMTAPEEAIIDDVPGLDPAS